MSHDAETTLAVELRARRRAGSSEVHGEDRIFAFTLNDNPPFGFNIHQDRPAPISDGIAPLRARPRTPLQPLPPSLVPSPPRTVNPAAHDITPTLNMLRGLLPNWNRIMEPDVQPQELLQFLQTLVRQYVIRGARRHLSDDMVARRDGVPQSHTEAMLRLAERHLTWLRARARRPGGRELYRSIGVLGVLIGMIEEFLRSHPSSDSHNQGQDLDPDAQAHTMWVSEAEECEMSDEEEDEDEEAEVGHAMSDYCSTQSSTPELDIGECPGNHKGINRDYHCYASWTGVGWRCYFCLGDM
ncbi:hypothetical protein CspeluHIS016_0801350 [Cutaneotrichosporon spelunceum]|uniref:Uncharacterized protein n=1 Tax=Cutaneotrichosporon spelunceum TaxID=1672016 RepID=A0AAD3YEY6_9TREE|nr:hypothetical protein CspeluHIS016_0801350 [Cutaneotrichosporon spelunceum]